MFKVNKSKGTIGVLSLLLLVSLAPSANAGKPGSTPSLNGTLCKSFGGTWKAGKTGTCNILYNSPKNYQDFKINAGDTLFIGRFSTFQNYAIVTNYGKIQLEFRDNIQIGGFENYGPSGRVINNGIFTGCINNYSGASGSNVPTCLAAPAFTLSSSSETREVNTVANGFTINSTGGAIANFASDATPPGMSFNTSTGALTGTPNTVASATTYTVTATNATGSATQTFTLTVVIPAVVYTVGQRGPGGGIVYYVAATPFTCGPTLAETCTYLEAAPTSGINAWTEAIYVWSETNAGIGATAQGVEIGTGFKNTLAMIGQNSAGASGAGNVAQAFRGPNNLTDWFLPSKNELNQLYLRKADSTVEGFLNYYYWSSTEADANYAWSQGFLNGYTYNNRLKLNSYYVRPVRAF